MSRATLHDHSFLGHQGVYSTIMRQAPQEGPGADGGRRPSRLLQMRDDYQRRLMKEKEERMVSMYETQQKKNLERAERLTKAPAAHDDYPNSRLRQPGYMQQQQQASSNNPSVRDFFRERREMEATGGYVPPINQHFNDSRTRTGSGRAHQKNSAGVDRANPLAPLHHTRQGGINSAPTPNSAKNKPQQRVPQRRGSQPGRDNPAAGRAAPKSEKLSDFQKWQMEQNKAREERLKKLNMRAPPSERESRGWGGGYEYEEEAGDDDQEDDDDDGGRFVDVDQGQEEEIRRREQEILQRIAQQQEELDRLRREREEEEELERQQAEELRRQQAADRERRQRQQQEEVRRRRQEVAQARREEEEQQRAARARQERQRFEAHLDLHGDESSPTGYASQPNSFRERYSQPSSHRENPFQPGSHRDNFSHPDSSRYRLESDASVHQPTPKFTPKPPSEGSPRKASQTRFQQQKQQQRQRQQQRPVQKRGALPAEERDEVPVPGPGVDFYAQAVDEEQGRRVRLVACRHCQRKFADDRIQKHQDACKNSQKKREAFDPTQMRTDGTDMAKYIRQGAHMKEHRTKKKADWRQQHQEFITNIRYAKQLQQLEQKGVAAKDLPAPPPSKADPDLVPCPHCGRTFNEQSAERHIPRCQELKTRPVANNRSRR